MATAYIALGSNLGERAATLWGALAQLNLLPGIRVVAVSGLHETAPVGGPHGQPSYLNAAARLSVELPASELLEQLLATEAAFGRTRRERWGPRTLDLDLLLYNGQIMETQALVVPHPRMHERRFVLEPLADLAPDARHPLLKRTVAELLAALDEP